MEHEEIGALRRELATHERGPGKRYPAELKARLAEYARRRRAAGANFARISEDLGVSYDTVCRWCTSREAEQGSALAARARSLVPVEIVAEGRSPIAIVSPSGFRLEGLDLAEAVAALRELR
jgi:transposase-like protein